MKLNVFFKGYIMALVGFIATLLSDLETVNALYIILSTAGFTFIYLGKNYILPSISVIGFDLRDTISALIVAVGMGISSYTAQVLTVGFSWDTLLIAVGGAVLGYILKTVPSSGSKKISKV